jgi:hypothetical protein
MRGTRRLLTAWHERTPATRLTLAPIIQLRRTLNGRVARLERLGAERVRKVQSWWVMRDPAGLVFCVLPESPGSLTGENAQHWD